MRNMKLLAPILLLLFSVSIFVSCTNSAELPSATEMAPTENSPPPDIPAPKLISPDNKAILDNGRTDRHGNTIWDFDWSDVLRTTQYQLWVSCGTGYSPIIDRTTTSSSYHYENKSSLVPQENYSWKVRTMINGIWSEWSEIRTFELEPLDMDLPEFRIIPAPVSTLQPDQLVVDVGWLTYNSSSSLFQSFTPAATELAALGLLVENNGWWTEKDHRAKVNIRTGTSDGLIVGTSSVLMRKSDINYAESELLILFKFQRPISLTPGQVYVIELVPTTFKNSSSYIGFGSWRVSTSNRYPDGTGFVIWDNTIHAIEYDFIFITYH
jgi:hypothetical protein